jgi:hypothetical protein
MRRYTVYECDSSTKEPLLFAEFVMPTQPYTLWSIWEYLARVHQLFFLFLSLVSIYTLFSATVIMVRLRILTSQGKVEDISSFQRSLTALHTRSENVRQLIGASFYLFGFIFFLTLLFSFKTSDSSTHAWKIIFDTFYLNFAFAANVFFVFLVLHSVQWFVSARLHASLLRVNTPNTA